jgi:hypothetical protein
MSRFSIEDLDDYNDEIEIKEIRGSGYTPQTWNWGADFSFDFDSDGIASFAIGHISSFAIAIGPIIVRRF